MQINKIPKNRDVKINNIGDCKRIFMEVTLRKIMFNTKNTYDEKI